MKRLSPKEEECLNAIGDSLAEILGMSVDSAYSPDTQGRIRWKTKGGNKTGLGLLRTLETFFVEKCRVTPP